MLIFPQFTFAMDDTHNTLVLRLSTPCHNSNAAFPNTEEGLLEALRNGHPCLKTDSIELDLTTFGLNSILSKNPSAASEVFAALMHNVYEVLFGIQPATNHHHEDKTNQPLGSRAKGVFGVTKCAFSVVEVQARLTLHAHCALWTTFSTDLMQKCAHIPTLRAACAEVLDSYFTAQVRPIDLCGYLMRLVIPGAVDQFQSENAQYHDCPIAECPPGCQLPALPECEDGRARQCNEHNHATWSQKFKERFYKIMLQKNTHQHSFTCKCVDMERVMLTSAPHLCDINHMYLLAIHTRLSTRCILMCVHVHRKGTCGQIGCRMCFPRALQAQTDCVQLHLSEPPVQPVVVPGTNPVFDGCKQGAKAKKQPKPVPDIKAVQVTPPVMSPGDRPMRNNAPLPMGQDRATHPFGPADERLLVWEPQRQPINAATAIQELLSAELADTHPDLARIQRTDAETGEVTATTFAQEVATLKLQRPDLYRKIEAVLPAMQTAMVDASPVATALLGCNTAAYPLGCTSNARAIMFYLVKYLAKEATELGTTLAFLVHAKRMIDKYPSRATDREDNAARRQTLHFVQIILNKTIGAFELADTQATSYLCGEPQHKSSVTTRYVFVNDACACIAAKRGQSYEMDNSDLVELPEPDPTHATAAMTDEADPDTNMGHTGGDIDPSISAEVLHLKTLAAESAFVQHAESTGYQAPTFGSAPVYRIKNAKGQEVGKPASQYETVLHRGAAFRHYSMWECSCMLEVTAIDNKRAGKGKATAEADKTDADPDDGADGIDNMDPGDDECDRDDSQRATGSAAVAEDTAPAKAGRKRNVREQFRPGFVLHGHYEHTLKSKFPIPLWAGGRPDRCPPPWPAGTEPTAQWQDKANKFAFRMLCVLCPLVCQADIDDGVYDSVHFGIPTALALEEHDHRTDWECLIDWMQENEASTVGRCRNRTMQNLSDNLGAGLDTMTRRVFAKYRGRCATVWNRRGIDACQVDQKIGNIRPNRFNVIETAEQKAANEKANNEAVELLALSHSDDTKPTPYQVKEAGFLAMQRDKLDAVYGSGGSGPDIPTVQQRPRSKQDTLKDAAFEGDPFRVVKSADDDLWNTLINRLSIKPAFTPVVLPGPPPPPGLPEQKEEKCNADQERQLQWFVPLASAYAAYNLALQQPRQLDHHLPVPPLPALRLISGGPGTDFFSLSH